MRNVNHRSVLPGIVNQMLARRFLSGCRQSRCFLAFMRVEEPFAQTDGVRRDLDQFIAFNIGDGLLQ